MLCVCERECVCMLPFSLNNALPEFMWLRIEWFFFLIFFLGILAFPYCSRHFKLFSTKFRKNQTLCKRLYLHMNCLRLDEWNVLFSLHFTYWTCVVLNTTKILIEKRCRRSTYVRMFLSLFRLESYFYVSPIEWNNTRTIFHLIK